MFYFLLSGLFLVCAWFYMTVKGGYFRCTLAAGCALALQTPMIVIYLLDRQTFNAPGWYKLFIALNIVFCTMAIVSIVRKYAFHHHCPWDKGSFV